MKLSKKTFTGLLVLLIVAAVVTVKFMQDSRDVTVSPLDIMNARIKGDPAARIRVVEFIDLQCPACATGAKTLKSYIEKYPDEIYLELRYFPLNVHKHGFTSAKYGQCAARQGKFWPFFYAAIARQDQWGRMVDARPALQKIAEETELHIKTLNVCLESEEVNAVILKEKERGKKMGVRSTPTYFINGKMLVGTRYLKTELDSRLPSPAMAN